MMRKVSREVATRRLWFAIWWSGPAERLGNRLMTLDPATLTQRREIPDGSLRERASRVTDRLEVWWAEWHLRTGRKPWKMFARERRW